MSHYVCKGGCGGVSDTPKDCGTEGCNDHGKPLVECTCADGQHGEVQDFDAASASGE